MLTQRILLEQEGVTVPARPGAAGPVPHATGRGGCAGSGWPRSIGSEPGGRRDAARAQPRLFRRRHGPRPARSWRPSGSATTRCGRPRPTAPTPSRPPRGWRRAPSASTWGPRSCRSRRRTPAMTAMTAMTLDALSGGRFRLGLGVSGPQVVEGWHGVALRASRWRRPASTSRSCARSLRREKPVEFKGEYYQIPYAGAGATGLGKPLRSILHGRPDMPIYLAAIGPRNVALAAEIADGWIPIFFSPRRMPVFREWLEAGFRRRGRRQVAGHVRRDADGGRRGRATTWRRAAPRSSRGSPFTSGGMGARGQELLQRHRVPLRLRGRGAERIQDLYLAGRRRRPRPRCPTRSSTRSRCAVRASASASGWPRGRGGRHDADLRGGIAGGGAPHGGADPLSLRVKAAVERVQAAIAERGPRSPGDRAGETTARTSREAAEALGSGGCADREVAGVHRRRRADHGGGVGSEPGGRGQGGPAGRWYASTEPTRTSCGRPRASPSGASHPSAHASKLADLRSTRIWAVTT